MAVRIDHIALAAHDALTSATFLSELLDLPAPRRAGPFLAVDVDDTFTVDYAVPPIDFPGQHVAFLVDEGTFDGVLARLHAWGTPFCADPGGGGPGEINTRDGGRGLYVDDPAGHHLEVLTRRYGSGPG